MGQRLNYAKGFMVEPILKVRNLSVDFGSGRVLDGVSFDLKEKENLAVLGPNGAGKSVLLKCLLGIVPFEGEARWAREAAIAYVPQKVLPEKTLPLTVEEFFRFKGIKKPEIKRVLAGVGIGDSAILRQKIGLLSSGQLQRVLIAWGVVGSPDVLLFDEPTAGIDIGGEETVYGLLARMEREKDMAIVMVTHDLNVVYKFADSVLCLNKKALCYGAPEDSLTAEGLKRLYGENVKIYKHEH